MKKKTIIAIFILISSVFTVDTMAQFGGITKKVKKTIEKTEDKTGNKDYSKNCLRHKKQLDLYSKKIETYLAEKNLRNANNYIANIQKYINRYKKDNCPFVSKWVEKREGYIKQYEALLSGSDPEGYLFAAIKSKDVEKIDYALSQGADINKENRGNTPLIAAILQGDNEIVSHLIAKGADVNKGSGEETPVYYAVKKNNIEILKLLLNKSAKLEPESLPIVAAANDNLEILKILDKQPSIDISAPGKLRGRYATALSTSKEGSEVRKYLKTRILEIKASKVTEPTNKKFANQMVFSTSKIEATGAKPSQFTTKLRASKNIYGRIYLGSLISEYYYGDKNEKPRPLSSCKITIWGQIEGDKKEFHIETIDVNKIGDASTYEMQMNTREYRDSFHEMFMRLKQGSNKVVFRAQFSKDEVLFSQEITLTKQPNDYFAVGRSFADYKAGNLNKPSLKTGVLKAIQSHASNAGWSEKFKAAKVESNEWNIVRHNVSGAILYRTLSAACFAKWPDGHCTVQPFTFKQVYNGSSYSSNFTRYSTGSQKTVDCK